MSNSQIISYQLKKFQYEMDQAIINHYYKIIFIHGVGEGILKSAIREELKKYADIKFSEAPYEKFGHGATEVIFS
jgi:dsDNA-specific endonuclease/ATPase MutS2